jgi:hypothetical protein
MDTRKDLIEQFQLRAFQRGDYERLNAYLWLEVASDSMSDDDFTDRLMQIHSDTWDGK